MGRGIKVEIPKNRRDRGKTARERILELVRKYYQNQNDHWPNFLNALATVKCVDNAESEDETKEEEEWAVNYLYDSVGSSLNK